ncbi:hypothetical protein DM02DRAFT_664088 [Periconia macrospinosa]|uniref:MIT domain-containing protein n=1 Tax=Periconia macrospinosa TaxID=97972 RepID=A0A2V1D150_9PLEO|nr:hypothetical protein DM02DRAFT_664088 [Periconia macrospinosa]
MVFLRSGSADPETRALTGDLNNAADEEFFQDQMVQLHQDLALTKANTAVDTNTNYPVFQKYTVLENSILRRALTKANTAVLLDNAQNFEGALPNYGDACKLLYGVVTRSSQAEERQSLNSIINTYKIRIEELNEIAKKPDISENSFDFDFDFDLKF